MLQQIRENFAGTFAIVLLALIGLSFVFFGLNYSFIGQSYAAKVDGDKIDALLFENQYQNAIRRNPQLASAGPEVRAQVRRRLLDQLVTEQLVENYLDAKGFRVSDEQIRDAIRETPQFQVDGQFDRDTYQAVLAQSGMDPVQFEREQRSGLRFRQLQLALSATAVVTPAEYRRYLNLLGEQRVATVGTITADDVQDAVDVSDDMVAAYYEMHADRYEVPESADVAFIRISRDRIAEGIDVSEDDLEAYYETNRDRYLQEEQRRARHILITTGDGEDAARARAEEALARVRAGEAFADVAAELSDDGGTAANGGDLGLLTRSQLPAELGVAIFSMQVGEVDGPVEGEFGFHVVQLDEIAQPAPLPLDQVRGELLTELRQSEIDSRFRDLERQVSDALFDGSDLEAIAAATGLDIETATGLTRAGGEPFGSNQAVIDTVFSDAVLRDGRISDVAELSADEAAVFQVTGHMEASLRPLDDVRDDVVAALRAEQADMIMAARAEQMLEALRAGEDFAAAAATAGLAVSEPQLFERGSRDIDPALLFDVYAAGKPGEEKPVFGSVRQQDGAYAVYRLDAVLPGRPESIPLAERDRGKLMLAQQSGIGDFQAFVAALRDNADIVINEDVLAATDLFQ